MAASKESMRISGRSGGTRITRTLRCNCGRAVGARHDPACPLDPAHVELAQRQLADDLIAAELRP